MVKVDRLRNRVEPLLPCFGLSALFLLTSDPVQCPVPTSLASLHRRAQSMSLNGQAACTVVESWWNSRRRRVCRCLVKKHLLTVGVFYICTAQLTQMSTVECLIVPDFTISYGLSCNNLFFGFLLFLYIGIFRGCQEIEREKKEESIRHKKDNCTNCRTQK